MTQAPHGLNTDEMAELALGETVGELMNAMRVPQTPENLFVVMGIIAVCNNERTDQ